MRLNPQVRTRRFLDSCQRLKKIPPDLTGDDSILSHGNALLVFSSSITILFFVRESASQDSLCAMRVFLPPYVCCRKRSMDFRESDLKAVSRCSGVKSFVIFILAKSDFQSDIVSSACECIVGICFVNHCRNELSPPRLWNIRGSSLCRALVMAFARSNMHPSIC